MRSVEVNGINIYELTKDRVVPEYLTVKRQKKLKDKDNLISNRLEVIQDLSMPDLSTNISLSPDGNFLFVLGAYSPRVKCFELEQMSMKFERNVDELPTKIAYIERDYSKFVILEGHKTISFHGQGGIHKKVRTDDPVSDLIYSNYSEKLYVPTVTGGISMIDLNGGVFYKGFISGEEKIGINCAAYEPCNDVFMCGTNSGAVNGYDPRCGERIYNIDVTTTPNPEDVKPNYKPEIAKLVFKNPMMLGVGTDKGVVHLYDVRNSRQPWSSRDLDYRRPIVNIIFHEDYAIGAVHSVFKIWEPRAGDEGTILACYDTLKPLNDLCQYPGSGMFIGACNDPQLPVYFVPRLGNAPRWCEKLNNLVVNMAVESQSLYDTHTFVTLEELDELNLRHLIGTASLRAYTHGYYINTSTYRFAAAALEQRRAKESADSDQPISVFRSDHSDRDQIPDPRINAIIKECSVDPRFATMFECDEFIVDQTNHEFARVVERKKHLEKKRRLKMSRKESAMRAHKLTKVSADDDDDDVALESDSESE